MTRLTKEEYYLNIARAVAERSTCLRARAGTVIVKEDVIISTGYIGSARGDENCCDIGVCERDRLKLKPGERYELCRSVHSEANAIINAARNGHSVLGGTMYIYFERLDGQKIKHNGPCIMCQRMIKNVGITQVKLEEVI